MGIFSDFVEGVSNTTRKLEFPKTGTPIDLLGGVASGGLNLLSGGLNLLDFSGPKSGALSGGLLGFGGSMGSLLSGAGAVEGLFNRAKQRELLNQMRSEQEKKNIQIRNDEVFRIAGDLSRRLAGQQVLNPEEFLGQAEPQNLEQEERLKNILSLFKTRMGEVQQGQLQPALSQTRLSLVQ